MRWKIAGAFGAAVPLLLGALVAQEPQPARFVVPGFDSPKWDISVWNESEIKCTMESVTFDTGALPKIAEFESELKRIGFTKSAAFMEWTRGSETVAILPPQSEILTKTHPRRMGRPIHMEGFLHERPRTLRERVFVAGRTGSFVYKRAGS